MIGTWQSAILWFRLGDCSATSFLATTGSYFYDNLPYCPIPYWRTGDAETLRVYQSLISASSCLGGHIWWRGLEVNIFTYSEARQKLAKLLDKAKKEGRKRPHQTSGWICLRAEACQREEVTFRCKRSESRVEQRGDFRYVQGDKRKITTPVCLGYMLRRTASRRRPAASHSSSSRSLIKYCNPRSTSLTAKTRRRKTALIASPALFCF